MTRTEGPRTKNKVGKKSMRLILKALVYQDGNREPWNGFKKRIKFAFTQLVLATMRIALGPKDQLTVKTIW